LDITIILIISAAVAIYIALPFFLKSRAQGNDLTVKSGVQSDDPITEKYKTLDNQKETFYSAIRDIDFDYGLGKLSKEDYEELKNKYKLEAASVLKEMDNIQKHTTTVDADYELEQEILSYRKTGPENLIDDKKIEEQISAFRSTSGKTNKENKCSQCEAEYSTGDLFCSKCAAKLN